MIRCMVEKDAIRAVDEALAEVRAHDDALTRLKAAVRHAHNLGYPKAVLARRTGFHVNTITHWCAEKD